jgi:hypothetical protein
VIIFPFKEQPLSWALGVRLEVTIARVCLPGNNLFSKLWLYHYDQYVYCHSGVRKSYSLCYLTWSQAPPSKEKMNYLEEKTQRSCDVLNLPFFPYS